MVPLGSASAEFQGERADAIELVIALARAMKNASFYETTHPVVRNVVVALHADLVRFLEAWRELSVRVVAGYAVIQGGPLVSPHVSIGNLLGACHRREAESLVIRQGATMEELEHLLAVLVADPAKLAAEGGVDRALEARGVERIRVGRRAERQRKDWQVVHAMALDVLRGAAMGIRIGQPADVAGVRESVREIVENMLGDRSLLHNLTALKGMDEYTFVHALDICVLATELGRNLDLDRAHLTELSTAALLHDVGKVLVPLEILRKPGPLDHAEFAVMSQHPVDGAAMLLSESELPEVTTLVAFEHHMHCDLSGYPKTRFPRELNLYSLMTCIADIYDALTTARPYRQPLPPLRALELMDRECRGQVEPSLFLHFVRMLGPFPWGTLLGLPGGRVAIVTRPNAAAPDNPYARLLETDLPSLRAADTEVPVQQLMPRGGEVVVLDPVDVGLDLTAILHGMHGGESLAQLVS